MKRLALLPFGIALLLTPALAQTNTASSKNDPMLAAMQAELAREKADLVLPGMQRPYFIEYRLDDQASYEAVASYGALVREESNRQRVIRVTVRIGDYKSDSSSSRGDGTIALAPLDNDPAALRYALWTATDTAYKNALSAYSAKQAALRHFQAPPTADDFSPSKAITKIDPLVSLDLDRTEWKHRLIEASGLYVTDPTLRANAGHVETSSASLRGIAVNRYLVNTEGTVIRHGYTGYQDGISVGTQAADGMELNRSNGSVAVLAKDLESAAALRQRTINNLKSLEELRNAPLVAAEDYHGPVLFSGDAASDVFERLFVPNVEADRPDIGTAARTQGAYTSSLHTPILSPMLNVKDDPTLAAFDGQKLLGAYDVDDEGVPAQPVEIVEGGKFLNFLIGREPVKDFPESNGHGRAALAQPAHSHAGTVIVSSTEPFTSSQMRQKLLALAHKQTRDVYEVQTMGGELTPRLLYLVHPDGKRELVRGAVFDELDTRSLRSGILAAGNDAYVDNVLGQIPQTFIAPSLLFADIAVKRANEEQQKLPYYEPPPLNPEKQ